MSFDTSRVQDALRGTLFEGGLHHFTTIDSTNTRALADAQAGAAAGQVYLADEQTAGRGRGGHTWHSRPDRGLYCTVLVRPALESSAVLKLSLAAAIACSEAIAEVTGVRIDLRWPNDLVYAQLREDGIVQASRKLGGILTEVASTTAGVLRHAAIGIGINLNQAEFPADLREVATSLQLAAGRHIVREEIAIALLRHLDGELQRLAGSDVFERFSALSSWVTGRRVRVAEGESYTGVTAGLTAEGLLRVQSDDGQMRTVRHGGVRELIQDAAAGHGQGEDGHAAGD